MTLRARFVGALAAMACLLVLAAPADALLRGVAGTALRSSANAFGHTRMAGHWEDLTPEARERARRNFQKFQSLPESEQERIRLKYRKWRQLSEDEKEELRRRRRQFLQMPEGEKERIRKGLLE